MNPTTNDEFITMLSVLAVIILVAMLSYYVYKKYSKKTKDYMDYDNSKKELRIDVNTETNKAIVDYLNTLKVVQGTDLTNLENSMREFVLNLINEQSRKIEQNKQDISNNQNNIKINKAIRENINQPKIQKLESEIKFLRKGIKYDIVKIIMKFVNEYENKYTMTTNQKNMFINTSFVGLLNEDVYKLFDKQVDEPDIFIKKYNDSLLENTEILLNEFNFMDGYGNISNLHYTAYTSNIPYLYSYILNNKDDISFESNTKKDYIIKDYIPLLLRYIINNRLQIYEDIDNLMTNYYANIPKITFFNEFLTSVNIDDVINNNNHLLTKCMKRITAPLYTNWTSFKQDVNVMFTPKEMKLLFVLIPEYLMMMNYNTYKLNKYVKYIESDYFMNMPSNYLNTNNIENFANILEKFTCTDAFNNIMNDSLKIYLSESLSTLCTTRHSKFINEFLIKYNNEVSAATSKFSADNKPLLEYNNFVCESPPNIDIENICNDVNAY